VRRAVQVASSTSRALRARAAGVNGFLQEVEAHGGDLVVNDLKSPQPDDPHFVLPRRARGEMVRACIGRTDVATVGRRKHPRSRD
jgi:hypothetical protein